MQGRQQALRAYCPNIYTVPLGDHNAEKNKFFAIASGMLPPDSPQDATAALISPYLVVSDHPKECFGFWVYFAVSISICHAEF